MRRSAAAVVVGLLVIAAGLVSARTAYADGKGQGTGDSGGIGSTVDAPGSPGGGSHAGGSGAGGSDGRVAGGGVGTTSCTAGDGTTGPISSEPAWPSGAIGGYVPPPPGETGPGQWYRVLCGGHFKDTEWVPSGAPPPGIAPPSTPVITGAQIAQQARKTTPLDPPALHMNPPASQDQLAHLVTLLWSDATTWHAEHATASLPGISATTTAVPVDLLFDMGDGQSGSKFSCPGPGTPYDPAKSITTMPCKYAYPLSSAGRAPSNSYRVTAWTEWRVTWAATDGTSGDFGIIRGLPTTQLVRVAEAQAVNTK